MHGVLYTKIYYNLKCENRIIILLALY